MYNKIAENVFGTIGTICWTAQLVPQVRKSYKTKSTSGLSHWLMLLWGISATFLGLYAILQRLNVPLMVQPQIFGFLSFICWGQCQYYGIQRSLRASVALTTFAIVLSGILELALVLAIRPSHNRGKHAPADVFGIFGSVLVSVALFPQYWEIYKYKEVLGISMLFISVDIMGGIFNLLSLTFKEKFDAIAAITYSLVVVLDGIVVIAALILNPMAHKRRRREAQGTDKKQLEDGHASLCIQSITGDQEHLYSTWDRGPYADGPIGEDHTHHEDLPSYTANDQSQNTSAGGGRDVEYGSCPPDYEGSLRSTSPSILLPPPAILHKP